MAEENVGGTALAQNQLDSYLNEVLPESDYVGERYKFQGDILIVRSLVQMYDDVREQAFTVEGQMMLRGLIKDVSDSVYSLTKLNDRDIERMMNFLTIQENTVKLSLTRIDITPDLNIIFAKLEKIFYAILKNAHHGFAREMAATGIVKQRTEFTQSQQTEESPEQSQRRFWQK